ncbi:MAG: hypothetical protein Ta2F_16150 [Termitinemataceae bacterium]|nr:MAG: hypothetical protein Ta2F_16150 [Termitinemataceae bacterium]
MTKLQSFVFRIILFLFGAGIIALAFYLINGENDLSQIDKFTWISIAIMYVAFFCPFFFSHITIGNFSVKIPNLALVWTALLLYIVISIVIIILLNTYHISFNMAVIVQAILVFLFAIDIYFSYFASTHVHNVAVEEANTRQYISDAKTKAANLILNVQGLTTEYEQIQKTILKSLEDIKYMSPVSGNAGTDLELKIIASINSLSQYCEMISEGGHPSKFENEANNLQLLIKQRKLVRN